MEDCGEEEEVDEEEDGSFLDFEAMEEEARDAVRDYSRSLSRQLGIGNEFDCLFMIFLLRDCIFKT